MTPPPQPPGGGGVIHAFRTERRKLGAQAPARVVALACVFGPLAFAGVLGLQAGVPGDALLGVWVHSSGFAVALVILGFAGSWGFPVWPECSRATCSQARTGSAPGRRC